MDSNRAPRSSSADAGGSTSTSDSPSATKKHSKKPKYSRFTQQELPACKPILTPALVISIFTIIGIIFIPIGLVSLSASEHVVEIVDRYDEGCVPPNYSNDKLAYIQSSQTDKSCIRTLSVPKLMKSPVFIYYQLDNFYQNHRRYVKSRSDKQLRSKAYESETKSCDPEGVSPDGPIVLFGPNDWPCPMCGNINWAKRTKCNICNTNKPGHNEGGVRGGRGGGYKELDEEEIEETRRRRREAEENDGEMYDEFGNLKKKFRAKTQQAEAGRVLPGSGRAGWEVEEIGVVDRDGRERSRDRGRERDDREISRNRDREDRERRRSRSRERDRGKDRSRDYDYDRDRDYGRDRYRDRSR